MYRSYMYTCNVYIRILVLNIGFYVSFAVRRFKIRNQMKYSVQERSIAPSTATRHTRRISIGFHGDLITNGIHGETGGGLPTYGVPHHVLVRLGQLWSRDENNCQELYGLIWTIESKLLHYLSATTRVNAGFPFLTG